MAKFWDALRSECALAADLVSRSYAGASATELKKEAEDEKNTPETRELLTLFLSKAKDYWSERIKEQKDAVAEAARQRHAEAKLKKQRAANRDDIAGDEARLLKTKETEEKDLEALKAALVVTQVIFVMLPVAGILIFSLPKFQIRQLDLMAPLTLFQIDHFSQLALGVEAVRAQVGQHEHGEVKAQSDLDAAAVAVAASKRTIEDCKAELHRLAAEPASPVRGGRRRQ